jgi:hypothetical protein
MSPRGRGGHAASSGETRYPHLRTITIVGLELQLPPGGSILELVEFKLQLELSMDRVTQQVPSARCGTYIVTAE